jgi:hypothetical protein
VQEHSVTLPRVLTVSFMLTTLFYYGLDGKAGMWFELYHKTKSCDKV